MWNLSTFITWTYVWFTVDLQFIYTSTYNNNTHLIIYLIKMYVPNWSRRFTIDGKLHIRGKLITRKKTFNLKHWQPIVQVHKLTRCTQTQNLEAKWEFSHNIIHEMSIIPYNCPEELEEHVTSQGSFSSNPWCMLSWSRCVGLYGFQWKLNCWPQQYPQTMFY